MATGNLTETWVAWSRADRGAERGGKAWVGADDPWPV